MDKQTNDFNNQQDCSSTETRYILYDGYNNNEVRQWLNDRHFEMYQTGRNNLLFVSPYRNPMQVSVVRPREIIYINIVNNSVCTFDIHYIFNSFMCCAQADQLSDAELMHNILRLKARMA